MEKFVVIAIAILLSVVIGTTMIMGDKNSVKSSLEDLMSKTTVEIDSITK